MNYKLIIITLSSLLLTVLSCCKPHNSNNNDGNNSNEETAANSDSRIYNDNRIKYDLKYADTGWCALFDTRKNKRCYITHDDYYSIKKPSLEGLSENYSHLIPLGMVIKYPGANIIWGFAGVQELNWINANDYATSYSPDGHKWRLLSMTEASAISSNSYNFDDIFVKYYPNDLRYLGSYGFIENWTSEISSETWTSRYSGISYNKVYTLHINNGKSEIQKEFTLHEDDLHNVYPISSL